MFGLTGLIITT